MNIEYVVKAHEGFAYVGSALACLETQAKAPSPDLAFALRGRPVLQLRCFAVRGLKGSSGFGGVVLGDSGHLGGSFGAGPCVVRHSHNRTFCLSGIGAWIPQQL